jgi:secernin
MCDTMVVFNQTGNRSFFAKNSDREPGELQFLNLSSEPVAELERRPYLEAKEVYLQTSFPVLKEIFSEFTHPYKTFLSRPVWNWGAEMGVNEFGLAIGNEALFAKEKLLRAGLLGMDILRLALHNCKTAREAKDFIIALYRDYPQGGDGGYRHSMKYFSAFLVKDPVEAYVIESCNQHWAMKKVTGAASISNSYSITNDFEAVDPGAEKVKDFKKTFENRLMTFFAKGDSRQRFSSGMLKNRAMDFSGMKEILRSHISSEDRWKRGMNSICVHPGLIQSATTASFIVDYTGPRFIVWITGSPHPCLSLFKPFVFSGNPNFSGGSSHFPFGNAEEALNYSRKLYDLARKLERNHGLFLKKIKPLRDEYENEFQRIIDSQLSDETNGEQGLVKGCLQCFDLEQEYMKRVEKVIHKE